MSTAAIVASERSRRSSVCMNPCAMVTLDAGCMARASMVRVNACADGQALSASSSFAIVDTAVDRMAHVSRDDACACRGGMETTATCPNVTTVLGAQAMVRARKATAVVLLDMRVHSARRLARACPRAAGAKILFSTLVSVWESEGKEAGFEAQESKAEQR